MNVGKYDVRVLLRQVSHGSLIRPRLSCANTKTSADVAPSVALSPSTGQCLDQAMSLEKTFTSTVQCRTKAEQQCLLPKQFYTWYD